MKHLEFLFCCDYFNKNIPDQDYVDEYNYLKQTGISTYLFSLEDFLETGKIKLPKIKEQITIIYRGWMLTYEQYLNLFTALQENGYILINSPEQYKQCHHLPNWYPFLSSFTPKSIWTNKIPDKLEIETLLKVFQNQSIIIKDYVKSRKYEWADACFIQNASNLENSYKIINNFIKRQASDLVGGIVIREYITLNMLGIHEKSSMPIANEIRIFCLYHHPFASIQYWNGNVIPILSEQQKLIDLCKILNSNFYTIDIAQKASGEWIIMEVGDGQVSGLQDYKPELFYQNLFKIKQ